MHAVLVGLALAVCSGSLCPAPTPPSTIVPSASAVTLREAVARASVPHDLARVERQQQAARVSRHSKVDRAIATVAGVALGWVVGGAIGYYATANRDNPDDDTSGLRGVIIGAPLGAIAGGVIGWRLTR